MTSLGIHGPVPTAAGRSYESHPTRSRRGASGMQRIERYGVFVWLGPAVVAVGSLKECTCGLEKSGVSSFRIGHTVFCGVPDEGNGAARRFFEKMEFCQRVLWVLHGGVS